MVADPPPGAESELLASAQRGDAAAFERLVAGYRRPLQAHCYRMLGSVHDAEDALQDALVGAWRGLAGFEGRSSLRSWLYRIVTNACLKVAARRPRRVLPPEHGPASTDVDDVGQPVTEPVWLEPYPDAAAGPDSDPEARAQQRESVELAFVAALQHLAPAQRAVLILRDVLRFSAAEVAEMLDATVPSVNSALQRAHAAVDQRVTVDSQRAERRALGEAGQRALVGAFVTAWERADVDVILALLTDDARLAMPPLPAWFSGKPAIARFMRERMFATPWRLRPVGANGQIAFACYQGDPAGGPFRLRPSTW